MAYTTCVNKLHEAGFQYAVRYFFSDSLYRFQMVVLSAYKQIRSQTIDILSDINEDNYDRAFAFLRPG